MRSKASGSATTAYSPQSDIEYHEYMLTVLRYCCGLDPTADCTIDDLVGAITELHPKRSVEGSQDNLDVEKYEPAYLFTQKYRVSLLRSARRVWRGYTIAKAQVA